MNIYSKFCITMLHFLFAYVILISAIISNKIPILMFLLIIMCIVKYSFFCFKRCVVSIYEENKYYPTLTELFSKTITRNSTEQKIEEISINIIIVLILNKLLFLMIYNYFYKQNLLYHYII
jgi:hypothetical protein